MISQKELISSSPLEQMDRGFNPSKASSARTPLYTRAKIDVSMQLESPNPLGFDPDSMRILEAS